MNTAIDTNAKDCEVISLAGLSQLTGFPTELIKNELLLEDQLDENGHLSMDGLREALCQYIDKSMLEETESTHKA